MIGEVTAAKRPENSLLEKVLDVNYLGVGQMGEEADEETTDQTIEGAPSAFWPDAACSGRSNGSVCA